MSEENEYLVRGATLICTNGSHKRKINLPKCHGVYVREHPVLHEKECLTEPDYGKEQCNITPFGVCIPTYGSPPATESVTYIKTEQNSKDGMAGTVTGCKCKPEIIGQWRDTYTATRILDNGDKCPEDRMCTPSVAMPSGQSLVTTGSFLVCKYGGLIEPIDSGQNNLISEDDFYNSDDYFKIVGNRGEERNTPFEVDKDE